MRIRSLRRVLALGTAALAAAGILPAVALPDPSDLTATDLARYVDPLIGTVAPGFTVPGASVPYGMVQVSPDTRGPVAYSGYLYHDPVVEGFSLVHLNGPGVKKAGDFPFMPTLGPVVSSDPKANAAPLDHANERATAGYYQLRLPNTGINVELTATERGGLQRYTFPPSPQANVLLDVSRSIEGVHAGGITITGPNTVEGWAQGRYRVHFSAEFSQPFIGTGTWVGSALQPGSTTAAGNGVGGWVSFDTTTTREVTVKVGVSFVDIDGARLNRETEIGDRGFDEVRSAARQSWNEALSTIAVSGGTEAERRSFYTALYRAQTHPNVFSDVDGRYRGFDNQIHVAEGRVQYANFSSWDTYKAQNQLLATIAPDRYVDMIRSLLADAREGGKLPRWGEQNIDAAHMSGDPAIPMIVDGFCRGLLANQPPEEQQELYAEMVELVTARRSDLTPDGYVPLDRSSRGASTTLEYGVADFALALMADGLGKTEDAQQWLTNSERWKTLFDPSTKWIRPRNSDGSWLEPFVPTEETGFQEGNSWQYSWLAPHDTAGIVKAMGADLARERLDRLFTVPAEAQNRMTFFGLAYRFDQYAPGNEHDLQLPWQYVAAGEPWKAQRALRDIQTTLFRPTPDGLPGNDDLGSLSAWHVLSAIGFGPLVPGAPIYVIGSPLFERVEIRVAGEDEPFVVEAPGASTGAPFVQSAGLNGSDVSGVTFSANDLTPGGVLRVEMGSTPNEAWGADAETVAASTHRLDAFGCAP